ncbi:MAG: FAD-dependent thymidylate synthase [Verrucomicrobia bacterium]|nr:FAD-dependent thymidylate synthase [Verrucomicrobiota bacterium]MBS0646689.1 FAD-dependent thymidylate synthase [Verrucomicrobiota bacterium]
MQGYEEFTPEQHQILNHYVTNPTGNIFVLRNLPEVIKGALFSRYSRSALGLRSLLLKEFILSEETSFTQIAGALETQDEQLNAIKKAQNFYDRILDGYGDDSIGELGGAHVAVENISMLGAKILEDSRIGGSPLEKSTRYIYFDQKIKGQYLYYREPIITTSAYRDEYLSICDRLFETYSALIPPLTQIMEARFPKDAETARSAYNASIRAKVLDCLRGLLPASTLTNLGIFGNGRFWEGLCHKLQCQNLAELQEAGRGLYTELSKVIPSFVRRAETSHRHHDSYSLFVGSMQEQLENMSKLYKIPTSASTAGVHLRYSEPHSYAKVATALLFNHSHASWEDLYKICERLSHDELAKLFEASSSMRENRRHKSPRALEHASFTFEILADFGVYRDLQRHRMLTQDRQLLTTEHGYFIPEEIIGTEMEKPYREVLEAAAKVYQKIAKELPEEAQYVVPMAYNIRWYFHVNLRALQWLCELRSSAAGHPNYRCIAQDLAKKTTAAFPLFECFFKFVDYEGYNLGRLGQEQRQALKNQKS